MKSEAKADVPHAALFLMVHLYSKLWENYGTCHFIYDLRVLLETGLIVKIAVSLDPFIQRHTHIIPQTRGNKNRIRKLTYIYNICIHIDIDILPIHLSQL